MENTWRASVQFAFVFVCDIVPSRCELLQESCATISLSPSLFLSLPAAIILAHLYKLPVPLPQQASSDAFTSTYTSSEQRSMPRVHRMLDRRNMRFHDPPPPSPAKKMISFRRAARASWIYFKAGISNINTVPFLSFLREGPVLFFFFFIVALKYRRVNGAVRVSRGFEEIGASFLEEFLGDAWNFGRATKMTKFDTCCYLFWLGW